MHVRFSKYETSARPKRVHGNQTSTATKADEKRLATSDTKFLKTIARQEQSPFREIKISIKRMKLLN
jgi:hypothetical protein